MGNNIKKNPTSESKIDPTDELLATLIKDIHLDEYEMTSISEMNSELLGENAEVEMAHDGVSLAHLMNNNFADENVIQIQDPTVFAKSEDLRDPELLMQLGGQILESVPNIQQPTTIDAPENFDNVSQVFSSGEKSINEKTVALGNGNKSLFNTSLIMSDKTVAVAGFSDRYDQNLDEKVKVSIGQVRTSPLSTWNKADSNLGIAHNMELAQDKIVSLEKENENLRQQNEELVVAAEIIKERADMLASEMSFLKNDRDSLEQSFKNELMILRNQLSRKDSEVQKANSKAEELESRLKFDMKKIRVRERELENRLELLRAEKNALVKSKDEMILDLRRKCDQFQLETESFRQKCIELNKVIESSQESVKRTTRALRLAMANLELQDEGKQLLKKAD